MLDVLDAIESRRRLTDKLSLLLSLNLIRLDADVDRCVPFWFTLLFWFIDTFVDDLRMLFLLVSPNVSFISIFVSFDEIFFFSFTSFSNIKPAVNERSPDRFFILRGVVRVFVVCTLVVFITTLSWPLFCVNILASIVFFISTNFCFTRSKSFVFLLINSIFNLLSLIFFVSSVLCANVFWNCCLIAISRPSDPSVLIAFELKFSCFFVFIACLCVTVSSFFAVNKTFSFLLISE